MQPNYFPKLKDKNFLKQLLRSQMNFVPLVSGHGLTADSFFLLVAFISLSSPEQVFFFVSMKAQKYIDCSRHLEKLLQNWGRRGRQGGGGKDEIFFSAPPSPSSILTDQPLSWWQEKISIMVCTAKYSCFAGYHLLSSNCFHKSKGSLFTLPWTHTPSGTICLWPGRVLF